MIHLYNLSFINERFSPIYSVKHILFSGILGSVVVFLLLFLFQPFKIYEHAFIWRLFLSFIYATIPFLLYIAFYFLFKKKLKKDFFWSLKEEFLYFSLNFFIGGILVYGYSYLIMDVLFPFEFSMPEDFFLKSIYYGILIGLIVYFFSKIYNFLTYFYLTANSSSRKTDNSHNQIISFFSYNNTFKFNSSEILLIESSINDTIVYQSNDDHIDKILIKNTSLKEIEKKYPFPQSSLLRCHKSFLVNFNHIKFMRGNSRTTILKVNGDLIVPVSRHKINFLKELLNK